MLARVSDVRVKAASRRTKDAAAAVVDGIEVLVPLAGVIDVQLERTRLRQRVDQLTKDLSHQEARLRNTQFVRKAPKEVIQQATARWAETRRTMKTLSQHLAVLESM